MMSRQSLQARLAKWQREIRKPQDGRYVSPLLLRILAVNVMALVLLVGSVLYLGMYQQRLVATEMDALRIQAFLSASALGEGAVIIDDEERNLISAALARSMIRRFVEANETRTRLYDTNADLLADSRVLQSRNNKIKIKDVEYNTADTLNVGRHVTAFFDFVDRLVERRNYPTYQEVAGAKSVHTDIIKKALSGENASQVWSQPQGGLLLTAAVPVQRYRQVLGVLLLTRPAANIDAAIREVRQDILKVFGITMFITALLSLYLSRAIARPIRLLAQAAEGVRHGQMQIVGLAGTASLLNQDFLPDFSSRHDEIGDLSSALRDMTSALAQRISAIENFAADVAHEIKNPLTSLRSAVETAERVQDPAMQRRLMAVIRDDVDRLDRLISDISNASRLDAELSRDAAAPVDLTQLITTLVDFYHVPESQQEADEPVVLCSVCPDEMFVMGVEVRLVQVLQNLISNALSFSPPKGKVVLTAKILPWVIHLVVEDDGPGIPENKLEAIFDRFYSERPKAEKFGTHSGLGLSISKQIAMAHRGRLWAENRLDAEENVCGARFVLELPRAL